VRQYRYRDEGLAGLTNSALAGPRQEVSPDWLLTDLPVRVQAVPAEVIASMLVLQDVAGPLRAERAAQQNRGPLWRWFVAGHWPHRVDWKLGIC
jgi:hypothetical protein